MGSGRIPVNLAEQRIIALMFIGTGSIFTGIASTLGMLRLITVSGDPGLLSDSIFSMHPYLQILGFLSMFVMGVAYSLIPSLKSYGLPSYGMAKVSFLLITIASLGFLLSVFTPGSVLGIELEASLSAVTIASILFFWEIQAIVRRGRKNKLEGDAYIIISSVSFLASTLIAFYSVSQGSEVFSQSFLYLSLGGFIGSMIFGVVLKTVAMRFTLNSGRFYRLGIAFQSAMVVIAIAGSFVYTRLLDRTLSVVFLISAILFVMASRSMQKSRLLLPEMKREEAHLGSTKGHRNLRYLEFSLMSSSLWLIFGALMGIMYNFSGFHWVRIAMIHSLGIGFIGSTIIGMSPVLLPGILSRKAPSGNNSLMPLWMLDAGLAIFVSGDLVNFNASLLPWWASIGGVTIVASMVLFIYAIHSNLISGKKRDEKRPSFTDEW